jgi:tetratricopeptide (TPR) repeat protein
LITRDKNLDYGLSLLLQDLSYQAIEYFKGILEEDPELLKAWFYLSAAYYNARNYEESYSASDMVLQLDPANLTIYGIRGSIFLEAGQYETAIESFDKYLVEFPDDDTVLLEKAYCHYTIGQISETIQCYNKILESFPRHREAQELRNYVIEEQLQHNQTIPAA